MGYTIKDVRLAHEPDIAWLIALWLAIHGGDPSPEQFVIDEATMLTAAALTGQLAASLPADSRQPLGVGELKERLSRLNVEMSVGEIGEVQGKAREYSFKFRDTTIKTAIPSVGAFEPQLEGSQR